MNSILAKCLKNDRKRIVALAKQQDVIYKRVLKALKVKQNQEPAATMIFDYLHNGPNPFSEKDMIKTILDYLTILVVKETKCPSKSSSKS